MTSEVQRAIEALEGAKCLEEEGQALYRKAAERTTSDKGKAFFRFMIREEVMHERLIQRQIDILTGEGAWAKLPEVTAATCDLTEAIFPRGREGLEKAVPADTTDTEALIMAMEWETKSYDKYRRRAQEETVPLAREMYEFLASQERVHFDLLMTNYEALVNLGGWAD
jgi:rubrerythrin